MERDWNEFPAWLEQAMRTAKDPLLQYPEGLSIALKKSRTTIYNWLSPHDTCRPRTETARQVARLYNVPEEEVLNTYVSRKPGRKPGT